jgi:hypothetical protein
MGRCPSSVSREVERASDVLDPAEKWKMIGREKRRRWSFAIGLQGTARQMPCGGSQFAAQLEKSVKLLFEKKCIDPF